MQRKKKAD